MAVTAVTITSGPTVVGRSVTLSGTLSRDGGGTNNNLNFLSYTVGYASLGTITRLSDSAVIYNAAGTAGTDIAWTWTGVLPEGDYLTVTVNLADAPYTTLAASVSNVGLVQLRKPLSGIWTPRRDSRGLFVELPDRRPVAYKDYWNDSGRANKRKTYHYATPDGQIYWSATDNLARFGEYGNLSSAMPTPYGVGIDVPQGWEWPVGTKGGTSSPGGYSTNVITYVSIFYLHNSSKYHDPVAASKFAAILGDSQASSTNAFGYWSNPNGEQAIKFGLGFGSWGEALQNITVNNVGNGLHCLVVVQCNDPRSNGHRVFLDGQLVGSATYTTTYLGGLNIRPYYFWGSLSKSGLDIGTVLFQGSIDKLYPSDEQAKAISSNPYSYFFRDAPKSTAKSRLFSGLLSLPDPPTEFSSIKGGRRLPQRWNKQPQGAVQIDWNNPLTKGIVLAQNGNELRDVVYSNNPSVNGSKNITNSSYGQGIDLAGSNSVIYQNSTKQTPTTQFSILSITQPASGQAANTNSDIFGRAVTGSSQAWGLGFYVSGFTTNGFGLNVRNSGGFSYGTNLANGDNYQYTRPLIISGSAGLNYPSSIYLEGILKSTGLSLNDTLYNPGSAVGMAVGSANGTTSNYNGKTFLNVLWNRILSNNEHLELGLNPWQIFKPNPGRVYFLPSTITPFKGGKFLPQRWKNFPSSNLSIDKSNNITKSLTRFISPSVLPFELGFDTNDFNTPWTLNDSILSYGRFGKGIAGSQGMSSSRYFVNNSGTAENYALTVVSVGELVRPYDGIVTGTLGTSWGSGAASIARNTSTIVADFSIIGTGTGNPSIVTSDISGTIGNDFKNRPIVLITRMQNAQPLSLFIQGQFYSSAGNWTRTIGSDNIGNIVLNHSGPFMRFYTGIWRRYLSNDEVLRLYEDPWQIFKPKLGRIYFLPGSTKRGKFLFLFN